jgi:hypothetical protein
MNLHYPYPTPTFRRSPTRRELQVIASFGRAKFLKLTGLVIDSVHPDPKSKSFATRCIFLQAARDHEDDHTLAQKNSAAIAIDALPRLKLLAMASARARQTEQPVKVGMNVTHKSYGAGKVVGEWGTIRSGVPCKDIFDVIFQNRSGRPFLHCCRKEYLTPDPLFFTLGRCCDASCTNMQRWEASPEARATACSDLR